MKKGDTYQILLKSKKSRKKQMQHFAFVCVATVLVQTTRRKKKSHTDTIAGSVLCLAHSFIFSLGVCEVWQPISARTPETVLIYSCTSYAFVLSAPLLRNAR